MIDDRAHLPNHITDDAAAICRQFPGKIIHYTEGDNPYLEALLAARSLATHLWLLDGSCTLSVPVLFQFSELKDSYFVSNSLNEKNIEWRRTLVSTQPDWQYSTTNRQWEYAGNPGDTDYFKAIHVGSCQSEETRQRLATKRIAQLFDEKGEQSRHAANHKEIAQHFETLGDLESAANWYHQGARPTDTDEPSKAYCTYKYLCLVFQLSQVPDRVEFESFWLDLFDAWPTRAEPLYQLAQIYIDSEDWSRAWSILEIALDISFPDDQLPIEAWIYQYGLHYQAAQCARALSDDKNVLKHSVAALHHQFIPGELKTRLVEWQSLAYTQIHPGLPVSRHDLNFFVVIIPFRNCAKFLQLCIDSLTIQNYPYFKVIFIDDVSTDGGLEHCDLSGLADYHIIHREQRLESIGNHVDALQNYCDPSDIAVFLDGDDQLADATVIEYLNTIYNQTGCWFTYGQFSFNDSPVTGYARPVLESESIPSLFNQNPFLFPIHLRTHRAGLIHELLKQDPGLNSLKGKDGKFIQCASDTAHARAMMQITPRDRIYYISKVLYRYNTHNPRSHFQSPRRVQQFKECQRIGQKPELEPANRYTPFSLTHQQKTRLLVVMLPGMDLDLVKDMMTEAKLPALSSVMSAEELRTLTPQRGLGNYMFTRAVLCEEQPGEYRDAHRFIPRLNSYTELWLERNHAFTGPFFGERHILDGRHYAVLSPGEVSLRPIRGLTLLNQWMIHGQTLPTLISPEALSQKISSDGRYDIHHIPLERTSIAKSDDAKKILSKLSDRLHLKLEMYTKILNRGDWDCVIAGFDELHDAGHLLWHFIDSAHPLYQPTPEQVPNVVESLYQKIDESLAELLDNAGAVPVVVVGGPGMKINGSLNSHLDTILLALESAYTGRPVAAETEKRDRLFYAQYTDPAAGGIRLNLAGREPFGKVKADEYKSICHFLIKNLSAITNHKTKHSVVDEIYLTRDQYELRSDSSFPDLMCVWEAGSAYGVIGSELLEDLELTAHPDSVLDHRTGDHNDTAWLALNEQARAFFPPESMIAPHQLGRYFREIIESFSAATGEQK